MWFIISGIGSWEICFDRCSITAGWNLENNDQFDCHHCRMYRRDLLWSPDNDSTHDLKVGRRFYIYSKYIRIWASGGSRGGSHGFDYPLLPLDVLKYPMKMNNLVSVRPNYFIFMGYLRKMRSNQRSKPLTFIHMNPFQKSWIRPYWSPHLIEFAV